MRLHLLSTHKQRSQFGISENFGFSQCGQGKWSFTLGHDGPSLIFWISGRLFIRFVFDSFPLHFLSIVWVV